MVKVRGLIKILFSLKRKKKFALLFFPCKAKGDKDAVQIFNSYITDRHKHMFWYKMFREVSCNCYAEAFGEINPRRIPDSIILFAHPTEPKDGFFVNPSRERKTRTIRFDWWKCKIKHDWFIAHVCNGAVILNRPKWRKAFPNWLSFSNNIYSYVASKKGNSCWRSVINSILEVIPKSKCIKSMKEQMIAIYYNAMAELDDTYEAKHGDALNMIYLENCIQNIKTNEDEDY